MVVPELDIFNTENNLQLPLPYCTNLLKAARETCYPSSDLSTQVSQCPAGLSPTGHTAYALRVSYCRIVLVHLFG